MKLQQVINGDGMACRYSYVVYDGEELLAMDLIGAEVAVKAVAATLVQGKKVKLDGDWRQKRIPRQTQVSTIRTVLEQEPLLCRWHVVPQPSENDLAVAVYGWEEILPAADAFVGALGRWTVWPALPEWGDTLYDLGRRQDLIKQLESEGMDYAFCIFTEGWDQVIDQAVKEGLLPFPEQAAA